MKLPVAILAGGLGTRLMPLTKQTPKSLLVVAGDFFINHQLHYLCKQGILRVVLCLGHLGESIKNVVGDGKAYGLEVQYAWDGPSLLGTGGALRQALPLLGDTFFVLYGDSYLPIHYETVLQRFDVSKKKALLTIYHNKDKGGQSNVLWNGKTIIEYNKRHKRKGMQHIDYGLSIVSAAALETYTAGFAFDLGAFYHDLSIKGELAGYEVFERFYEVGSLDGWYDTDALLR